MIIALLQSRIAGKGPQCQDKTGCCPNHVAKMPYCCDVNHDTGANSHDAVDGKHEIITATDAAPGDVNDAHLVFPLLEKLEETTEIKAGTVVADSKYGTIDNFLACHDQGIASSPAGCPGGLARNKSISQCTV